jgi:hypothetical protein
MFLDIELAKTLYTQRRYMPNSPLTSEVVDPHTGLMDWRRICKNQQLAS